MTVKLEIEFNSEGFKQILCSDGMRAAVQSEADKIRDRANSRLNADSEGFRSKASLGSTRWIGQVWTTDYASMKAESEDKVLTGALT